jgi:SAM-dependent methyltransferase
MVPVPARIKKGLQPLRQLERLARRHAAGWARSMEVRLNKMGTRRTCYICRKSFHHFYPYRDGRAQLSPFLEELDIIGSDLENFWCPCCNSFDRERHLFMYFDQLKLWDVVSGGTILHVAPESQLRDAIAQRKPKEYVQGDLFPSRADVQKIDVTAIAYPENYFDLVICNHVLEHIPDDRQAMKELCRVLKGGKHAVIQIPFSALLAHSFEDPNINTDDRRVRFYGQEDHVRVYGLDLASRLESSGFEINLQRHDVVLPELDGRVFGVNVREDLILVKKVSDGRP